MKRYKSKIDFWLIFILILGSIILLQEIYITFQSYTLYQNLPYLVIYSLIFLLIWLPITTTYYVVDRDFLKV